MMYKATDTQFNSIQFNEETVININDSPFIADGTNMQPQ